MDNPFKQLDKKKYPKNSKEARELAKKKAAAAQPPKEQPVVENNSEEALFYSAMGGVKPLNASGRDVPPVQSGSFEQKSSPVIKPQGEEEEVRSKLQDLVSGKVEFTFEHTDEFILGRVKGLDQKILIQLKNGQFSPEGHLDLHGFNALQAYTSLLSFIRENYLHGKRCLLLIPGRGKNSPEGYAVLREKVQNWLTRDPLKRVVLAFCTALPKHGGAGALYVLLRRQKKNMGKIQWDRNLIDFDDTL